ncbi:MAG: molybdopterin-dependent oxidoreductase [Acidobacteriota bacterium]|nr:molybdopterin-dependent oxidoreductase [Acidobacteriota bacterium]
MDRRHFIKLTAITGTTAALTACGNPENQVIRFIPEEDIVPGVAVWKPSICPLCQAGCGVLARVMEGEAEVFRNGQPGVIRMGLVKKLEGNPADPISQGKLCARGQAAVQVTYHPDRLGSPQRRVGERGSGQFKPISWDEAIAELVGTLDALAAAGDQGALAFLTRPRRGRRLDLVAQLLARFGAKPPVAYELFSDDVLRRANAMSFGSHQLPTLDLEHTRYLINFGADFLGTWNSAVAQSVAYGRMRQGQGGLRGKFVHVEPRLSQTGANADEFVAIKPGTEGVLALGLAHVIMVAGIRQGSAAGRAGAVIEGWSAGLADYTPDKVEQRTGVKAAKVERLAKEFASHLPAVALVAGAPLAHTNGLFNALAVNALNALVGSVGQPGGVAFAPQPSAAVVTRPLQEILAANTVPKVLLVDDVNPVFASPASWQVKDALLRVPFIASFGSFIDETSALADLILPDHSFLESWVHAAPESGSMTAVPVSAGPAMRPLYDTRSTPDVLLDVSRRLAKPISPALPNTFEELLGADTPKGVSPRTPKGVSPHTASGDGRTTGGDKPFLFAEAPRAKAEGLSVRYTDPQFDGDAAQYPYHFMPYPSQSFLDGSLAHLPWLQELPDPMTSGMWCSWVEINAQAAEKAGIHLGDLIEITSAHGSVRAPAVPSPGIAPDAVAMPVGQGHTMFTRYASGRGVNPIAILAPSVEAATRQLAWSATRVKIARVGGPDASLILFAGATRERPEETHGRGD